MDSMSYLHDLDVFLKRVRNEVLRAKGLSPTNKHQLAAFNEEAGEVSKAFLEHYYGKDSADNLQIECVQAAAMAMRLVLEGDASFPYTGLHTGPADED